MSHSLPLVEELIPTPDPVAVFLRLAAWPHCVFLDSAARHARLGRYSFVTADPFAFLTGRTEDCGALDRLAGQLRRFPADNLAPLPPFQGGAAGLFSYDLGRQLETIPSPRYDEFRVPAWAVGLYDVVVAFDHAEDRCWIVSQGFPEQQPKKRLQRARKRLAEFRQRIGTATAPAPGCTLRAGASGTNLLRPEQLAPQFPVSGWPAVWSSFSEAAYLRAVERAVDYIFAGDVFQVNLAQRLLHRADGGAVDLYLRLRRQNPAPFAGYFDLGEFQLASASPERFLHVRDHQVETRPIKGTCRRTGCELRDKVARKQLCRSEKDRAENVMIVDLLRNDLSRVCLPGSVRVAQLCGLEEYQFVYHLVSAVSGRLKEECGPVDLIRAAFPGGSITGAPKIRAMEIIAELEPAARGAYCGSLGYIGFDGTMDLNILIRTIVAGRGWWQASVGGGIVAQSDPRREYEETWEKAEGLLRALCR